MQNKGTVILTRPEHSISRRNIDRDALSVLYHMSRHGYTAYLVGGSVRDLLLGRTPKDFDVGTNAHPKQIRRMFSNCFLIGRRFRLAHIKFGPHKVIETSTFRREPEQEDAPGAFQHRDNTFGTPEEDAYRRDFTINGLFYDIKTFNVIDHVGGLSDLKNRLIRTIGNPDIRFREDPVRMVRAVRFASRLGFTIELETYKAILRHYHEIGKASKPRLLEEVYRLFPYQSGAGSFRLLRRTGLLSVMFPELDRFVRETGDESSPLWNYLMALDGKGAKSGEAQSPSLIFGALFLPVFLMQAWKVKEDGDNSSCIDFATEFLRPVAQRFQMPKRIFYDVIHMFNAIRRFESADISPDDDHQRHAHSSHNRFMAQEFFPDALALYEAHVAAGNGDRRRLHCWHELYDRFRASHQAGRYDEKREARPRRFRRRRRLPGHAQIV